MVMNPEYPDCELEIIPGITAAVSGAAVLGAPIGYSHHPSLAPYYDIRIFVTCSPDEQARRLRKREGERYSNFVEHWIPLEEGYFANYSIEENAEMMVVTD